MWRFETRASVGERSMNRENPGIKEEEEEEGEKIVDGDLQVLAFLTMALFETCILFLAWVGIPDGLANL